MRLDWMMLTNHAETPPGVGLVYISGGGWDTVNVTGPPPQEAPPGVVTGLQGVLALRLLFHVTECGRSHDFELTVMDADGGSVAQINGAVIPQRAPNLPVSWDQGVNMAFPVTGLPIPRFGVYTISLRVGSQHLGDTHFRVVKAY